MSLITSFYEWLRELVLKGTGIKSKKVEAKSEIQSTSRLLSVKLFILKRIIAHSRAQGKHHMNKMGVKRK